MTNFRWFVFYFLILTPFIASAATFSSSELGLDGMSANKTLQYKGSPGSLDLFWNGKTLLVKKLSKAGELLKENQKSATWGAELKQDKLKFANSILSDIEAVNSSIKKAHDEKNRIAASLNNIRMSKKPEQAGAVDGDEENLKSELKDVNREISELKSRVHSLEYQRKKLGELTVYNAVAVINVRPLGAFFIKTEKGLYLADGVSEADKIEHPLTGQMIFGKKWTAKASSVLKAGSTKPNSFNEPLMELKVVDHGVVAISLMSGQQYSLKRVYNDHVANYEKLEKQHPVVVNKYEFKNDQLFLKYAQKNKSGADVLDINLKYTGKKNNLVQIFTKSPIKILDPENKSGASTSHIGILAASSTRLVELKKEERVQGRVDSHWVQNYKKAVIKLGSTYLSVEGVDYYGWESLWYMATWMHINRLSDRKINLITGQNVTGFSVSRTADNEYGGSKIVVSRGGASVYEFRTDNKGFVQQYSFVPFKQNLVVQSIETTTTRKNKRLLSEFAKTHSLIEIKG